MGVLKLSGGCQCGTIRYEISTAPVLAYCCHCTDCQQQSSSAFGMSVWFPADAFKLISGELQHWVTHGESGDEKPCAFCPDCGTRIYHGSLEAQDMLSVKGGSLDDIRNVAPIAHIWTKSAQPWMLGLLDETRCYETVPESFDDLVAQFQGETRKG